MKTQKQNFKNAKNLGAVHTYILDTKGITLVALVVTIVVLLILSGISINLVLGNNGIITKAKEAKSQTEKSSEKEGIEVSAMTSKLKGSEMQEITESELQKELNNWFGNGKATVKNNNDKTYTVTVNNREYTVEDDGTVTEGKYDKWDGIASTEPTEKTSNEIHIYTAAELKWVADETNNNNNNFEGYTIYLENNLDLGAREDNGEWETAENEKVKWTPIGKSVKVNANFEGNNHTIKGVYVNDESNFSGIIARSVDSTITNITVKNSYIKGNKLVTGGIVGSLKEDGKIENCHNINTSIISGGYARRNSWTSS